MNRLLRISCVLLVGLLMADRATSDDGIQVDVNHDCTETACEVLVEIRNPGEDSFKVDFEVSAYGRDSVLLGALEESVQIAGHQSWSHQYLIPVSSKPMSVATSSSSTRLRT